MNKLKLVRILTAVCTHFNINSVYLFSKSRKKEVIYARHIFVYLCLNETSIRLWELQTFIQEHSNGMWFDHATLLHAKKKIEFQINNYADIYCEVKAIKDNYTNLTSIVPNDVNLLQIAIYNTVSTVI